jgi:protein-S-isoprenylcysteine O-methyltransferase Ste14
LQYVLRSTLVERNTDLTMESGHHQMTRFCQRGGIWVLAQGALLLAVALLAMRFRGKGRHPSLAFTGIALLSLGAGAILAGAVALGRNLTPFPKPREKARLVRHGIFTLIRHPLYTGVMLMSLGWALVWQSLAALLMALGLIAFLDAKARREESWLREKFAEYLDYEGRVKRFIPGIY